MTDTVIPLGVSPGRVHFLVNTEVLRLFPARFSHAIVDGDNELHTVQVSEIVKARRMRDE